MKKVFYVFLVVAIFFVFGCGNNSVKINPEQRDKQILSLIKSDVPGATNIKILVVKDFHGKILANYTYYDAANLHYSNYGIFELTNRKLQKEGGGGGAGKTKEGQLLTISSGGAISPNPYLITYGEIFDSRIKSIRVTYSDNYIVTEPVSNSGYLIIREGNSDGIKTFEALDKNSKVVYHVP